MIRLVGGQPYRRIGRPDPLPPAGNPAGGYVIIRPTRNSFIFETGIRQDVFHTDPVFVTVTRLYRSGIAKRLDLRFYAHSTVRVNFIEYVGAHAAAGQSIRDN